MSQAPMAGRPMMAPPMQAPQRVSPGVYRNAQGGLQQGAGNPLAQAIARRPVGPPPTNPSGWLNYKPGASWRAPNTQPTYHAMPFGGIGAPFGQPNKVPDWVSQIKPQPWINGMGDKVGTVLSGGPAHNAYPTGGYDYGGLVAAMAKRGADAYGAGIQPAGRVGYSPNYQGGNF